MKAAFPYWIGRVAPVFDTARQIRVVEAESGEIVDTVHETLHEDVLVQKALRLAEMGVSVLVCGAISIPLHEMVVSYGIKVFPFVAGDLDDVVQAWLDGNLERDAFAMPGCCGRGLRCKVHSMSGEDVRGRGECATPAIGRPGEGQRRAGDSPTTGTCGVCQCARCGHSEPHKRDVPCARKRCPECGSVMTRQQRNSRGGVSS